MSDTHSHDHDHSHATTAHPDTDEGTWSEHRYVEGALRELLIEKGVITADDIRRQMEIMDGRGPGRGARVVARAWTDPDYKARLFEDANAAVAELDIDIQPTHLIALENTEEVHNVVVCTLCSCYPRNLLGVPPDWYKARAYRSRMVREPRAVLAEFGTELPDSTSIRVHDSTADMRYVVIPRRPEGTEGLNEDALAALVGRDAMIGVTVVTKAG